MPIDSGVFCLLSYLLCFTSFFVGSAHLAMARKMPYKAAILVPVVSIFCMFILTIYLLLPLLVSYYSLHVNHPPPIQPQLTIPSSNARVTNKWTFNLRAFAPNSSENYLMRQASQNPNRGFVKLRLRDGSVRHYGVSMYHQLHCMEMIRAALGGDSSRHSGHGDEPHLKHCLDYITQV